MSHASATELGVDRSSCRLRGGSNSSGTNSSATPPHTGNNKQAGGGGGGGQMPPLQRANKPCFLCCCCCCSCSCLAAKAANNRGNSGDGYIEGEPPPSLEEIRSWGKSFDKLMRSTAGRKVFRDFLRCEYSEENILFWHACEELKKESNPDSVEEKARIIYEDYISILSPKEVSLDSRVREIVNRNMVDPTPHTFDEAQLQIYTLMHRDSYPRFINSSLFKKLAKISNNNGNDAGGGGTGASATGTPTQGGRKESNA